MSHRSRSFRLLALLGALLPATAALSASSPWISDEGGRARLVLLEPEADGTRKGMIEIEPAPGWITYWREPGDSGIPPQLTPEPPATLLSVRYPAPKIVTLGDLTDIAYDGPVAFPVHLNGASAGASLDLFIGLCKEICIPFQASFTIEPGASETPDERASVAAAEARVPPAATDGLAVTGSRLSPTGDALLLDLDLGGANRQAEAVVTGEPGLAFTARGAAGEDGMLALTVPLTGLSAVRASSTPVWRALILSEGRAIETEIQPK